MKIAFLYILSLCLLMVGMYSYANDIVHHGSNAPLTAKHIGKMETFKFASIQQDPTVFSNSNPTLTDQILVSVENEDDDTSFRRKFTLLANFLIVLAGTLFLTYFFNYFKRLLYDARQLFTARTYKYILQGALRI
jgi:hypothetical protein